uniref:Protein asteroid 1 n=1 Tax=Aceria tosichella TaxID=561515 RepID=A0A6G1SEW3_9ACAR
MGVAGTVGVFKRHPKWGSSFVLRNTSVVIDTTNAFYWYAKEQLLPNQSKYGTSMIELGQFYRNLFKRLRERNVKPIVVYEGGRKDDQVVGNIVGKSTFLERSSRAALGRLNRGNLSDSLPDLAINCLKEIVNELSLGPDQVHQAGNEVYPLLVQLSRQHECPVLTHHTDFIFQDVPQGFIRLDELVLPTDSVKPIGCTLYKHSDMLNDFRLTSAHSGALSCLAVLLRDDFSEVYYDAINNVLELQGGMRITPREWGMKTARLDYVLRHWPSGLTTTESVRSALLRQPQAGRNLAHDFDAMLECYNSVEAFESTSVARAFSSGSDQYGNLNEALTKRESSADFLTNVILTNFNRTGIEDIRTYRSTFSLQDRAKQYLMQRLGGRKGLQLFDRRRSQMDYRSLAPIDRLKNPLDQATLFALFHFDKKRLESVASKLQQTIQLDADHSNRLALMLFLASFACRLVPRENFNNNQEDDSGSQSGSSSLGSDQHQQMMALRHYSQPATRTKLFACTLNQYVYLQSRTNQGDQSRQEVPADTRVARDKVHSIIQQQPPERDDNYYTHKHLVEALNSVLHAYKELNSLYNFPGPNILVNKYYDGVVIFKLLVRYSNRLQGFLLNVDPEIINEL